MKTTKKSDVEITEIIKITTTTAKIIKEIEENKSVCFIIVSICVTVARVCHDLVESIYIYLKQKREQNYSLTQIRITDVISLSRALSL